MDALFGLKRKSRSKKLEGIGEPSSLATWCKLRRILYSREVLKSSLTQSMRHIIAILLQNEAGALSRVAGLFSTRGYNIESLSVAPTDDPTVSRLTLVTTGSDQVIQQIANQLNKLVDVVNVLDMTRGEHLERELVLLKLKVAPGQTDAVRGQVVRSGGRVLDPAMEGFIVELTASEAEVNGFVADLSSRADLLEVVRSGALGIGRSARPLRVRATPTSA
jgi:acetolactate synthase I/III small subunit